MAEEVKTIAPAIDTENKSAKKEYRRPRHEDRSRREDSEFDKVLIEVRRVTKVVKGGRTMRFSALVVVGDKKGSVGLGTGKAAEVPQAIDKATASAKKNMKKVPILNGTIPHEIIGKFGSVSVHMFPAKPGTGIIAGGSARSVLELAGLTDVVTKIHGSTNKINSVRATFKGIEGLKTKEQVALIRGISVDEI